MTIQARRGRSRDKTSARASRLVPWATALGGRSAAVMLGAAEGAARRGSAAKGSREGGGGGGGAPVSLRKTAQACVSASARGEAPLRRDLSAAAHVM
eukprot:5461129-Prymnesium_polylepis.1